MIRAVCTRAQVEGLKESRLTIGGDGDQDPVASLSGGLNKARHIVRTALLVQSATLKKWSVQGCKRAEYKTYSPLDDRWVILTTSRAFHYFRAWRDEIRFAFDPPKSVDKITVEDRVWDSLWYIILKRYCTKSGQKFRVQSRLSYATLQGTLMKRSNMTGGLFTQSPQNDLEDRKCLTSQHFQNRIKSLDVLYALLNIFTNRLL